MVNTIPVRFPPPRYEFDGKVHPPVIECGQQPIINGVLVTCTRPKGHKVFLDWGHTNGYIEWIFDTPMLQRS